MTSAPRPDLERTATLAAATPPAGEAPPNAAFLDGYSQGVAAAALLPSDAPFDANQRAWLSGFLGALFGNVSQAASQTAPSADDSAAGASPVAAGEPLHTPPAPRRVETSGPPVSQFSQRNPYAARILEITPLGSESVPTSWHLTLDIEGSGITSATGDLLGVFPANDPDLVRRILRLLGARGQETVTTPRGSGPAWRALLEELDLQKVQPELVWLLSSCAQNSEERANLEKYAQRSGTQPGNMPAGEIPEDSVFTLMRRFPSARPNLDEFTAALAPLVPQTFPLVSTGSQRAETLEALLALDGGTPSGIIADLYDGKLKQGEWLPIYVKPRPMAHPPSDSGTPVIVIAHGQAAASARAFFAERSIARDRGRNWLFVSPDFGSSEVHYARQFAAWQSARVLARLDVAPRENLIERFRAQFDMLQRWLTDHSCLYIFGNDAECKAFEVALTELLVERARVPVEEARTRLELMQTTGQLRFVSV